MAKVQADPVEIRRFQRNLGTFNRELKALTGKLQTQLRALNETWRDDEYRKFEQEISQVMTAFNRYLAESERYSKHLDKKAAPLEQYGGGG